MRDDFYREFQEQLLARIDPHRVREYARATGWNHEPRLDDRRMAVYERPESRLEQIIIPLVPTSPGFVRAMTDVVFYLAEWEHRPPCEVLRDLLLPPADVIGFQECGPIAISLNHGLNRLVGVRGILRAAVAASPPHPGQADADEFLHRCRLVKTEPVGCTVAIACPLEVVPAANGLADPVPFARQVTVLLMRLLDQWVQARKAGDPGNGAPGWSAEFCEGLLAMTPEGNGSSLIVTAHWARELPLSTEPLPPVEVRLRDEDFAHIGDLAQGLGSPRRPTKKPC